VIQHISYPNPIPLLALVACVCVLPHHLANIVCLNGRLSRLHTV